MTNNDESISSAVLTATIKSLKVLATVKKDQNKLLEMIADQNKDKKWRHEQLEKIDNLATSDDISKLAESLIAITESQAQLIKQGEEAEKAIRKEISDTDTSTNIEIVKRLVKGMKQVYSNMVVLSDAMNKVDDSMQTIHNDFATSSDVLAHSNARITSMDMRMAAFLDLANDKQDPGSIKDALKVLETLPNDEDDADDDVDEQSSNTDSNQVKFVSSKVAEKHQKLRGYVNELDDALSNLDDLDVGHDDSIDDSEDSDIKKDDNERTDESADSTAGDTDET